MAAIIRSWKKLSGLSKLIIHLSLALLLFAAALMVKNPVLPKILGYHFVREAVRKSMYLQTLEWNTLESDHFLVRYQDQDADVAGLVLATAEKYYGPVSGVLGYTPEEKVPIIIYPDRASLNKSFGWDAAENAMGVYWAGVIRILSPKAWAGQGEDLAREFASQGPVAHEYAHLVVDYLTGGNYPRWLTEGVAQYVEREVTGFQFPAVKVESGDELYDLAQLGKEFDSLPNQALAYHQSLSAVDYFVERFGFASLQALLLALGQGKDLNSAFLHTTGQDLNTFEIHWKNSLLAAQGLKAAR